VRQWLSPKKLTEALALFTSLFFFSKKKIRKIKQFTIILNMITGTKASHHDLNIVGDRRAAYPYTKRCENVNLS
jgi:hypothetical protein